MKSNYDSETDARKLPMTSEARMKIELDIYINKKKKNEELR
jgi:hypothetical protein